MKSSKTISIKFILTVCALFVCSFGSLRAAGPITHALLTDHFLRIFPQYNEEEKNAFRAGTLFSDIRYLSPLTREETHFSSVTIEDILSEPSPFIAGMKVHSLVDEVRENFVVQGDHYSLLSDLNIEHMSTYLKFLEDEIIFSSLNKAPWKELVSTIHPDELLWGVDADILKRWHYLLDLSFSHCPSTLIFFAHLKGNGLLNVSAKEIATWNDTFETMAKSDAVKAYVNDLIKMFASQVKK